MSDPVAEALRAAAQASHAAAMTQDVCDASPEAELPIVAAAIAAFLRALPRHLVVQGGPYSYTAHPGMWPAFAAAVERAAREGRDG